MNWADIDKWIYKWWGKARITMKIHGMLQVKVKWKQKIKALKKKPEPWEENETDVDWETEECKGLWLCLTKNVFVSSSCLNRHKTLGSKSYFHGKL